MQHNTYSRKDYKLEYLPGILKKFNFIEQDILNYLNQNKSCILFFNAEGGGLMLADKYNTPSSSF
jgi:hypothetical protein